MQGLNLIQFIFLLGFVAILVVELSLFNHLKKHHPGLYVEMGSPKFGDSNLGKNAWKLQKFIWSFSFLKLGDTRLNFYCIVVILLGVAWIGSFLFIG